MGVHVVDIPRGGQQRAVCSGPIGRSNAALRDAFKDKLATDPAFAGSPDQRRSWLLRQTPYADADYRVYPILKEE
jgi:hypothetical protein